ncbi:hypothetical protein LJC31_03405 [Synergistaceae bacterium OttesenSCG-928-I11]|nr:hypothetical protein [Synergistaceae bacterium OttesenSCG-928-I11]
MRKVISILIAKRNTFFFTALLLLLFSSTAYAADGLDINKKGFGPKIKGHQLGTPVSMEDFVTNCRKTSNRGYYTVAVITYNEEMLLRGYVVMQISVDKWQLSFNAPGLGQGADISSVFKTFEHIDERQNFGDYFKAVVAEANRYPAAEIQFWSGNDYFTSSAARRPGQKTFRYDFLKFGENIFEANDMSGDDFAKAAIKKYSLDKNHEKSGWYGTVNTTFKTITLGLAKVKVDNAKFDR